MKRTINLTKNDITEAVRAWLKSKGLDGFEKSEVYLTIVKADRPWESDSWEASITEK